MASTPLQVEMIVARVEKVVGGLGTFTQYARHINAMARLCLFTDEEARA